MHDVRDATNALPTNRFVIVNPADGCVTMAHHQIQRFAVASIFAERLERVPQAIESHSFKSRLATIRVKVPLIVLLNATPVSFETTLPSTLTSEWISFST